MREKSYKYILPDQNNKPDEKETNYHSIVIIGANGSGKSRLGVWMENNNLNKTHRISAQRSLIFNKYIELKSYKQSQNLLTFGAETPRESHDLRWNTGWNGGELDYTTSMLNDYEYVLSTLIAIQTKQQDKFIKDCKQKESQGEKHDEVPEMILDKLKRIWNTIFSHRTIDIKDGKVIATLKDFEYEGRAMSDGERVTLYLIAQCLCVPEDKIIIIDEPEIHLHRSIMDKLWTSIEAERKDCFFIYITHDTQFAATHKNSEKLWIKNYDGTNWNFEEIKDSNLPEQLLLDILGNRKPVLFVEGTSDSYDTKLYSEIYKDYYIIPCGSCSSVIAQTKSMNANEQLHHLKCYGIIDRDYRNDYEIEVYKRDNIFALEVAEVENLFLTEELLCVVNKIMEFDNNSRIENIKKYIIEERFAKTINKQICEAIVSELKFELSTVPISEKSEEEAKKTLDKAIKEISYDNIKIKQTEKFNKILDSHVYKDILKVFNCKSLSMSIGHFLGINNKEYQNFILRQIKGEKANDIINAIIPYLPKDIPI
ncbi:DUF4435 domain-containing protein [Fusobacterium hwasookii]|uniref:DUF4435 domain-containing protein n=1 Tax=Fusobacterium hwasookii TaxID=1583098 RepID=UPI000496DEA6|nr:DUF4435 domain-containing protein [Fusobacterium hwasookii]QNE69118.1 DUF4435 domain-containing protein [Fusobacterium hwasookii]